MKSLIEILRLIFSFGGSRHLPSIGAQKFPLRCRNQKPSRKRSPSQPSCSTNQQTKGIRKRHRVNIVSESNGRHPYPLNPLLRRTQNSIKQWQAYRLGWQHRQCTDNPGSLIGVEDAFEHTPILAGEQVAFCTHDKVAYHLSTWEFLRAQNQGCCCICGQSHVIKLIRLPGTLTPAPQILVPRPTVPILPGEHVIGLQDVPQFVGMAVMVQDFVHEVYRSRSAGTYFVRFEPRGRTILHSLASNW